MPNNSNALADAGELGDDVEEIGDEQRQHQHERRPQSELLAESGRSALCR
jgi:hypothetical protein